MERQAELEWHKAEIRNCWRIAAECGEPVPEAEQVFDMVLAEMKYSCPNLDRSLAVAGYARRWVETGNPYYIDAALYLCSLEGVTPLEALAEQAAKVALARFNGVERAGTSSQIRKANAREWAMTRMAKLCAAGATHEIASSKVARWMADMDAGIVFKASTLEKYFTQEWQDISADMKERFAKDAEHLAYWQVLLETLPEAAADLKGNRRE